MELIKEFEKQKYSIQVKNYIKILNRLRKFLVDYEMSKNGIKLDNETALHQAHELFCAAKNCGILDELNTLRLDYEN